ncbi:COP9 signalosome complex subunit 3 [Colletotrichum graminicola]|uniref:COP9 signalosome complex subunit 3 n=1 Tax=Colletotrichum graminicola (strain M1.001 / M2 / FGSC 10212) TaxID=645133 RepID=E3QE66_COLGM|nr:COP9 signalosome complex subunit 3 [Colletotrichum graminicola M1.001]EFQ29154.1 COP9 signalosome complex subunit 3 [Colletotrichum graminicola M1.001]WDK20292.1 COP9 signalosome complex subunit 3 [Colletotrichum graminicola]
MEEALLYFEHDNYPSDDFYDKTVKNHITKITRLFKDQASAIVANAPQLLQIVKPDRHSISHLAILNTLKHIDEASFPISVDNFREHVARFLLSYDARQIRYVGDVFYDLVKDIVECKLFPARQSIDLVVAALKRLDPDSAMLTSLHLAVVKLAYETANWDEILPIIERPWVFLPGMKDQARAKYLCDLTASPAAYISPSTQLTEHLTRENVMEHEYVSAMIFTAKKKWANAHNAYQRIVTWPSRESSVSKLMTDSHKRWILTGLLALGQAPSLPSQVSPSAQKSYATLSKPYADVAAHFSTTNVEQLKAGIEKGAETWVTDQTTTLVKEVVMAYQKWQILGLADVYHKISISEIRQQTLSAETARNLETDGEVEELLQEMVNIGMLQGSLEASPDGTKCLTFLPSDKEIEYTEYQNKIKDNSRIKTLDKLTEVSDARLAASKDYAKHILREQKRQDKDGGQSQNVELGFDASIEDEDLMSGLRQD